MKLNLESYLISLSKRGVKPGLDRMKNALDLLDHPERKFKSIHITGSNGKGSVCAFTESILRHAGYKTGFYSSPHLIDIRERFKINGKNISNFDFRNLVRELKKRLGSFEENLSYFEFLTLLAFVYFSKEKVDIAVIEVGLGGRLDSTNVLESPEVCAITSIALEHTEFLGDTLKKISFEKAGIIKTGTPCVISVDKKCTSIFKKYAKQKGAPLFDARTGSQNLAKQLYLRSALQGAFQIQNLITVLKIIEILKSKGWKITDKNIHTGVTKTYWPGRFQFIQYPKSKKFKNKSLLILDGAHNEHAITSLCSSLKTMQPDIKKISLVFNVMKDKNFNVMIDLLLKNLPIVEVLIPKLQNPRAVQPELLEKVFSNANIRSFRFDSVQQIQSRILKNPSVYLITGSLYVVGEFLQILLPNEKIKNIISVSETFN